MRSTLAAWLVLVVACGAQGGSPDSPAPESKPGGSSWEAVVAGIEDDGEIPLQVALAAFSLAIGDLPGVDTPTRPTDPISSGSGAVRWVLGHWDELTPEQQAAVSDYLTAGAPTLRSGPVLAMAGVVVAAEPDAEALLGLIAQTESTIAQNLGRDLGVPIELHVAPALIAEKHAYAFASGTDTSGGLFGPMAKCNISITKDGVPIANQIDNGVAEARLVALIAHETFHCFEMALSSSLAESYARPAWVVEGLAEWVGETVAGGSEAAAWDQWLELPLASLFKREYSAIGFYSHLQEHGADMWSTVDPLIEASDNGSEAAYNTAIGAAGGDVLTTWGPGVYRDPARAPDWDQDGPGITPAKYQAQTAFSEVGEGGVIEPFAERLAADTWDTNLAAEVVTISGNGYGMILLPDEATLVIDSGISEVLCTNAEGCTCPPDSPGAAMVFRVTTPGPTRIGLTGHLSGTKLAIRGWSLATFCEQTPEIDKCLVGGWRSVSYSSPPQEIRSGTGSGIQLVIDDSGNGMIDFDPMTSIESRIGDAPWVRVIQTGRIWFPITAGDAGAMVTTGLAGNYSIRAQVDLGSGYVDAGEGMATSGPTVGAGTTLECDGDTLTWTAAGEVSWYVFARETSEVDPLPDPPDDAQPLDGSGAGGEGGGGSPPAPPPDWGIDLDACALLTLDEVQEVIPQAAAPAGEDPISSQFLHQCTYGEGISIQVSPAYPPEFIEGPAADFGFDIVVIEGVGDWARAFVNQPNPTFSITDNVFSVSGANPSGTVTIVLWQEIYQDTPEFEGLIDLLGLALSRL